MEVLGKATRRKFKEKIQLLRQFKIFKNTSLMKLQKIIYFIEEKKISRNSVIFKEGDVVDGVYIIISGEFEYYKYMGQSGLGKTKSSWVKQTIINKIPNPNNYKRTNLIIMQKGEIVGFEEIYEAISNIQETIS